MVTVRLLCHINQINQNNNRLKEKQFNIKQ
jgi:hypothetical protein